MNFTPLVNANGIAVLSSSNVTVGTDAVVFQLNQATSRFTPPRGLFLVNLQNAIPTGTGTTLPIQLSMGGFTSNVTTYNNANWTVADVTGTGVYLVYYDRDRDILQVIS